MSRSIAKLALPEDNDGPPEGELWPGSRFGELVGPSVAMRQLFARLARIAAGPSTVLISGETGTGKELAARALHDASPRARQPFVVVDCGALPETLLEAELFGHSKGAFTGATQARMGAIEAARGGTVFLDEIGELPLAMQPKVLRALESRTVRRLGETEHRPMDVRFVAATHRDLWSMTAARAFREDLYYRLAVVPVHMPALRERPDDVMALLDHFLPLEVARTLTPEQRRELGARPWWGNVRELRNFAECATALGVREALQAALRPSALSVAGGSELQLAADVLSRPLGEARAQVERTFERRYLGALLDRHDHNVSQAARAAGVDRSYLHRLMARHRGA